MILFSQLATLYCFLLSFSSSIEKLRSREFREVCMSVDLRREQKIVPLALSSNGFEFKLTHECICHLLLVPRKRDPIRGERGGRSSRARGLFSPQLLPPMATDTTVSTLATLHIGVR